MTHNTRTRANLTAWSSLVDPVTPAEYNKLDTQAFESINGDQGGVYAPIDTLEIGGAGFLVSGEFDAEGHASFHSNADFYDLTSFHDHVVLHADTDLGTTVGDEVNINGTATFNAPANFEAHAQFNNQVDFEDVTSFHAHVIFHEDTDLGTTSGDQVDINGSADFWAPVTFHNTVAMVDGLEIHGTSEFHDDVELGTNSGDDLTVNATAVFEALVDFNNDVVFHQDVDLGTTDGDIIDVIGTARLHTVLAFQGVGRVPLRSVVGTGSSDVYSPKDYNLIWVDDDEIESEEVVYLIDDADAVDGDFFIISASVAGEEWGLSIQVQGGDQITRFDGDGQVRRIALIARVGGEWRELIDPRAQAIPPP